MSMVVTTLQADLIASFLSMDGMMDGSGNAYHAEKMALAFKTYILTGTTSTTDTGTAPGGSYTGAGVGTMTIDNEKFKNDLQATFEAGYSDDDLAAHMATDIDNACKADDTISEISTGFLVTSGGSSGLSGPAIGKFSGNKSSLETALKVIFKSMMGMMSGGGNEYYAEQLSIAFDAYLQAGTITVQLKSPFTTGTGSGKIT